VGRVLEFFRDPKIEAGWSMGSDYPLGARTARPPRNPAGIACWLSGSRRRRGLFVPSDLSADEQRVGRSCVDTESVYGPHL